MPSTMGLLSAASPQLGGVMAAKQAKDMIGGQGAGPGQYNVSPEMLRARDVAQQQAADFRGNLAGFKEEQFGQASNDARKELAGRIKDVRSQASGRGLLYSGLRQAGEAGAGAQSAGQLAATRAGINQRAEGQAQALENQAIQSGLAVQQAQQGAQDYNVNQKMRADKERNQGLLGMAQGLGGAAGMAAAR